MISILEGIGAEPQAVARPLEMFVQENKMMLAIYLTAPEIENDRRAFKYFMECGEQKRKAAGSLLRRLDM